MAVEKILGPPRPSTRSRAAAPVEDGIKPVVGETCTSAQHPRVVQAAFGPVGVSPTNETAEFAPERGTRPSLIILAEHQPCCQAPTQSSLIRRLAHGWR